MPGRTRKSHSSRKKKNGKNIPNLDFFGLRANESLDMDVVEETESRSSQQPSLEEDAMMALEQWLEGQDKNALCNVRPLLEPRREYVELFGGESCGCSDLDRWSGSITMLPAYSFFSPEELRHLTKTPSLIESGKAILARLYNENSESVSDLAIKGKRRLGALLAEELEIALKLPETTDTLGVIYRALGEECHLHVDNEALLDSIYERGKILAAKELACALRRCMTMNCYAPNALCRSATTRSQSINTLDPKLQAQQSASSISSPNSGNRSLSKVPSKDEIIITCKDSETYQVSGSTDAKINGTYKSTTLKRYSGAQPFSKVSEISLVLLRWNKKHWILADMGNQRDNFPAPSGTAVELYKIQNSAPSPPCNIPWPRVVDASSKHEMSNAPSISNQSTFGSAFGDNKSGANNPVNGFGAATTNVFGGTANQNVFGGNSNASAFGNSAATFFSNNQFQVSSTNTNASFGGAARASPNGSGSTVFGAQAAPFSLAPANTTFGTASTFGGGGGGGGSSFNPQGSAPTIFGGGGNPQTVTSPFSGAGPGTFGNSNNLSSFRAGAVPTPFFQSSPNSNGSSAFGNNNFGANNTVGGFGNSNQAPLLTTNSYAPLREPQNTKNGPPEQLIYVSITAQQQFKGHSMEELRLNDVSAKNNPGAPSLAGAKSSVTSEKPAAPFGQTPSPSKPSTPLSTDTDTNPTAQTDTAFDERTQKHHGQLRWLLSVTTKMAEYFDIADKESLGAARCILGQSSGPLYIPLLDYDDNACLHVSISVAPAPIKGVSTEELRLMSKTHGATASPLLVGACELWQKKNTIHEAIEKSYKMTRACSYIYLKSLKSCISNGLADDTIINCSDGPQLMDAARSRLGELVEQYGRELLERRPKAASLELSHASNEIEESILVMLPLPVVEGLRFLLEDINAALVGTQEFEAMLKTVEDFAKPTEGSKLRQVENFDLGLSRGRFTGTVTLNDVNVSPVRYVPHGRGRITFENGDTFEGSFIRGKRWGQGCFKHAFDGSFYIGKFENGVRHGIGTWGDAVKHILIRGEWHEGKAIAAQLRRVLVDHRMLKGKWEMDPARLKKEAKKREAEEGKRIQNAEEERRSLELVQSAVKISGVTGLYAKRVNGIYEPADYSRNHRAILQKVEDPDVWLFYDSSGYWSVTTTEYTKTGYSAAHRNFLRCNETGLLAPSLGTWCKFKNENSVLVEELVQVPVLLSGAVGEASFYVNGVFDPVPSPAGGFILQKRGDATCHIRRNLQGQWEVLSTMLDGSIKVWCVSSSPSEYPISVGPRRPLAFCCWGGVLEVSAVPHIDTCLVSRAPENIKYVNGVYKPTGDTYNGRPLLKSESGNHWLCYKKNEGFEQWVICPTNSKDDLASTVCWCSSGISTNDPTDRYSWKCLNSTKEKFSFTKGFTVTHIDEDSIKVAGASEYTSFVNGTYKLHGECYNGKPCFRQEHGSNWICFKVASGLNEWVICDTKSKNDDNSTMSWCKSGSGGSNPAESKEWKCVTSKFIEQKDLTIIRVTRDVIITGANDVTGCVIDGLYKATGEIHNGRPLLKRDKISSSEKDEIYLLYTTLEDRSYWLVTTKEGKMTKNSKGFIKCLETGLSDPCDARVWLECDGAAGKAASSVAVDHYDCLNFRCCHPNGIQPRKSCNATDRDDRISPVGHSDVISACRMNSSWLKYYIPRVGVRYMPITDYRPHPQFFGPAFVPAD